MRVTIKNGSLSHTIECNNFSVMPKYSNIWLSDISDVMELLSHEVCEGLRVLVVNNCYDVWQLGFKTEDITLEINCSS